MTLTHDELADKLQHQPDFLEKLTAKSFTEQPVFQAFQTAMANALYQLNCYQALSYDDIDQIKSIYRNQIQQWLNQYQVVIHEDNLPEFEKLSNHYLDELVNVLDDNLLVPGTRSNFNDVVRHYQRLTFHGNVVLSENCNDAMLDEQPFNTLDVDTFTYWNQARKLIRDNATYPID